MCRESFRCVHDVNLEISAPSAQISILSPDDSPQLDLFPACGKCPGRKLVSRPEFKAAAGHLSPQKLPQKLPQKSPQTNETPIDKIAEMRPAFPINSTGIRPPAGGTAAPVALSLPRQRHYHIQMKNRMKFTRVPLLTYKDAPERPDRNP